MRVPDGEASAHSGSLPCRPQKHRAEQHQPAIARIEIAQCLRSGRVEPIAGRGQPSAVQVDEGAIRGSQSLDAVVAFGSRDSSVRETSDTLPGFSDEPGGGLLLGLGHDQVGLAEVEQMEAAGKADVSFTPLAMPGLSGPGSIAVVIGLSASAQQTDHIVVGHVLIALGIAVVGVISYITLRAATKLSKVLGIAGMNAMARIMGFLLICIGVQFMINGVLDVVRPLEGYSFAFADDFKEPIDFLFIDGNHDYEAVLQDYEQWSPKVRPGGVIAFHDVVFGENADPAGPGMVARARIFDNPAWTDVKVEVSFVPRPCTTVMMATAMPAAIRPYSMAVAPDSSPMNFLKVTIVSSVETALNQS